MKKILFSATMVLFTLFFAQNSFAAGGDDYMNDYINFMQKLGNCTPAEYSLGDTSMKIYGLNNGICRFTQNANYSTTVTNTRTKETISVKNCDFRLPLSTMKKFADIRIRVAKAINGIGNVSQADLEKDVEYAFNLEKKSCR